MSDDNIKKLTEEKLQIEIEKLRLEKEELERERKPWHNFSRAYLKWTVRSIITSITLCPVFWFYVKDVIVPFYQSENLKQVIKIETKYIDLTKKTHEMEVKIKEQRMLIDEQRKSLENDIEKHKKTTIEGKEK